MTSKERFLVVAGLVILFAACGTRQQQLYPLKEGLTRIYRVHAEGAASLLNLFGGSGASTMVIKNLAGRQLGDRKVTPEMHSFLNQTLYSL